MNILRIVLKILLAPLYAVLGFVVYICRAILCCTSWIFCIAGVLYTIAAIIIFVEGRADSVRNGILVLISAFAVSPFGVPMLASAIVEGVDALRIAIWENL